MKLEEVSKIKQTTNDEEVNTLLAQGYKLIKIFSSKVRINEYDEVKPCYILGISK